MLGCRNNLEEGFEFPILTAQAICREHNIYEQTFYRWKKKYGDMELADAKRLEEPEKENAELKKVRETAQIAAHPRFIDYHYAL